jgi:hypothetical protein
MKKLLATLIILSGMEGPAWGDIVYTFSSGSGSSAIGFSAILPNYLDLAAGQSFTIPGSSLASCSLGLPVGGPNVCYSATLARTALGGEVSMLAVSIFDPNTPMPVAPAAIFPGLTFAQSGTFAGTIQGLNAPATFTAAATPEPSTCRSNMRMSP